MTKGRDASHRTEGIEAIRASGGGIGSSPSSSSRALAGWARRGRRKPPVPRTSRGPRRPGPRGVSLVWCAEGGGAGVDIMSAEYTSFSPFKSKDGIVQNKNNIFNPQRVNLTATSFEETTLPQRVPLPPTFPCEVTGARHKGHVRAFRCGCSNSLRRHARWKTCWHGRRLASGQQRMASRQMAHSWADRSRSWRGDILEGGRIPIYTL